MAVKQIWNQGIAYTLSYEILNPHCAQDILFLHGWGSRKEVMKQAFCHTLKEYRHVYVDLPGFGNSTNPAVLKTLDYCEIVAQFLQKVSSVPYCIVGHSFGGKIAVLLSPERLILLSSAGIPVKKSLNVRCKIKLAHLLRPFKSDTITRLLMTQDAKSLPPQMYATLKNVVDEDFSSYFENYTGCASIFWGKQDKATPLHCGERIGALMRNAHLTVFQGDHFFFLNKGDVIAQSFLEQNVLMPETRDDE
jgi:non-heme chloroperoxidase